MLHTQSVPCLDFSKLNTIPLDCLAEDIAQQDPDFLTQLYEALHTWGFFYLTGHCIPLQIQQSLKRQANTFFQQKLSIKQQIDMKYAGKAWRGYFHEGMEKTAGQSDYKEGLYFGAEHDVNHPLVANQSAMHGQNQWPSNLPRFREVVTLYMNEIQQLAQKLLACVSLSLGLASDYFDRRFLNEQNQVEATCLFRIFNYPAHRWTEEQKNTHWGVGPHTDMGFLTLILQDEHPGLQVLHPNEQEWIEVPPKPGSLVVNIGDMLELWTHGHLKATLHRVQSPLHKNRLSFPFFYDPYWNASLEKIPLKLLRHLNHSTHHHSALDRWDGIDLAYLNPQHTYGDFVWRKVQHVFPHLLHSVE